MKTTARLMFAVLLAGLPLLAQQNTPAPAPAPPTDSVEALRTPGWNKGIFVGGSTSFANIPSAQTFLAGARFGRVLTHELGKNVLRGSFEMAVDIIPINEFWIHGNAQY